MVETAVHENFSSYTNKPAMSSDEDDRTDTDDSSVTTDYDDFSTSSEDDEEDGDDAIPQPVHFRECLRLLDAALAASNPPILPPWCASEQIDSNDDPMLSIDGREACLNLPLSKQDAGRLRRKALPLDMKIDLLDGVSFSPSAYTLPASSFRILNPRWHSHVEPHLKDACVARCLQINPKDIALKVANLVLVESCPFPRQFQWPKEKETSSVIAKLFVALPSSYKGGKETISHFKEKHLFDLSDLDPRQSSFFTIVPLTDECQHEIDYISHGQKLIVIYDVISLTPTSLYNVDINEAVMARVARILDMWIHGLDNIYHSYSSKIVIPFSDTFQSKHNPLLHGIDRMTGTLLRRTLERYHADRFLLYEGTIQPNRSNDGTVHACRSLADLTLMNTTTAQTLFQHIASCSGNCNETYSGNIFLRRTLSEQGNFLASEQFIVPVWCLVPVSHKYDLFTDHVPHLLDHLQRVLIPSRTRRTETFLLIDWLLTTTKKIHFNAKQLLHQLLRLSFDPTIAVDLLMAQRQLFEHKKFLEQFFPMNNKEEYEDIIFLLRHSKDTRIELGIHQIFRSVLKRRSRESDRMKDAIKFIGVLSCHKVKTTFILVLVHELLSHIFTAKHTMPSITDLTNLLALLSRLGDVYEPSCQIIVQQMVRQIKISTATTSTITNLLRAVLVPTLVQIYRQWIDEHQNGKRKRSIAIQLPPWFISLYQTCLSLLNVYCNSPLPVPFYENLSKALDPCCCSMCKQLFLFLQNTLTFQKTFLIPNDQLPHFNTVVHKFNPLLILTTSMTLDKRYHQINIMKMSQYDEELWRENTLLRSLLYHIQLSDATEEPPAMPNHKRLKAVH